MTSEIPRSDTALFAMLFALLLVFAPTATGEDNLQLECTPRNFHVVPGEPMRVRFTVQAESAIPFRLHIPPEPLLKLRAIERVPVRRTRENVVVYERVVVWQGLEPGTVTMKTLSIETRGKKLMFPEVTITIRDPAP